MGRGKGYGTGSPISFDCSVGRREKSIWNNYHGYREHKVKLTGRERPYNPPKFSVRGARTDTVAREYICDCGHKGWSAHTDLRGLAKESKMEWNEKEWGTPEDHQITPGLDEYGGFKVGQKVRANDDGDEDSGEFWYAGDEGTIVGFSKLTFGGNHPDRTEAVLYFDGMDLMGTPDLSQFDPVD